MSEKEEKIYEVVFSYVAKDKDTKKSKREIIGPVAVSAKTERAAIAKAVIDKIKELSTADLLTLDIEIRGF